MESFGNCEVISTYTRAEALEDGELVDVSAWGSADKGFHGGFVCQVAFTRALWNAVEDIPEGLQGEQDTRGRAHDCLWMAVCALRAARRLENQEAEFQVSLPVSEEDGRLARLFVSLHGGDKGEPVVTIGFPEDF